MKRALYTLIALLILGIAPLPVAAQAEHDQAYEDDYASGNFGRVRYQENGVTILRAPSADAPEFEDSATVNAPVFPGDIVRTGSDQRAEIQLAGGTVVRVDRASEVNFLSLTDPYADFSDNTILKLMTGAIQLGAQLRENEEFRVDTVAATIYLLGDGDFRIEVDDRGRTLVMSRRGVAEIVGDGGSVLVRGGMRTTVWAGSVPDDPGAFNTFVADGFDRWVEEREAAYRIRDRYAYDGAVDAYDEIPYEVRPYYRELSQHGRWIYVADYGYCWYPYDVGAGWRPYYDGYWAYGPRGYFWVSYEPWGWAPYHYGRWNWVSGYGWCWAPGRLFAGAWVSWSWGSSYVGWCPLDYWNRPVYIGSLYYGYYDYHSWTFIGYNHFRYRNYRRHAVHVRDIGHHIRGNAVVTRPPKVSPRRLADDVEARRTAARRARDNQRTHLPRIDRDRKPGRSFADVENRIVKRARARAARPEPPGRGGVADGGVAPRRPGIVDRGNLGDRKSGQQGPAKAGRLGRSTGKLPESTVVGSGDERTRGSTRPTSGPRGVPGRANDRGGKADVPVRRPLISSGERAPSKSRAPSARPGNRAGTRRDTPTKVRPRQTGPGNTDQQVRDMFRRLGDSGKANDRSKAGSSSRKAPKAEPRRSTPQRKQQVRPAPKPRRQKPTKTEPSRRSNKNQQVSTVKRTPSRSSSRVETKQTVPTRPRVRSTPQRSNRPAPKVKTSPQRSNRSTPRIQQRRSTPSRPQVRSTPQQSNRPAPKVRTSPQRSNRSTPRIQQRRSTPSRPQVRSTPQRSSRPAPRATPKRSSPSRPKMSAPKRSAPSRSAPKARSSKSSGGGKSRGSSSKGGRKR
jgi:hypothetical protein